MSCCRSTIPRVLKTLLWAFQTSFTPVLRRITLSTLLMSQVRGPTRIVLLSLHYLSTLCGKSFLPPPLFSRPVDIIHPPLVCLLPHRSPPSPLPNPPIPSLPPSLLSLLSLLLSLLSLLSLQLHQLHQPLLSPQSLQPLQLHQLHQSPRSRSAKKSLPSSSI